ncbi:hypothetical protein BDR22DRAFT_825615 [Usnea florida]
MDGVSIAASIIGIATAGVQVSIKLATLATQISTASDRVSAIGNDISLTSNVLRQLGDLMTENLTDGGISILNPNGLESTKTAAAMCEKIFSEIEKEVKRGSEQLRRYKPGLGKMRGQKIELSTNEKAKWPFLQPRIDGLRADLRDAKSTLILLLQVATLALNRWMADASMSSSEHQDVIRAIVALELDRREERTDSTAHQKVSEFPSSNNAPDIGTSNRIPPAETVLDLHQNRSSSTFGQPTGPVAMHEAEFTISGQEFPSTRDKISRNPFASPGAGLPRGMGVPLEPFPGKKSPEDVIMNPLYSSVSNENPNGSELQLFLLKPLVQDLYDRIELRWTVQHTNMQPPAIREYMDKNEKDGLPPVVEMLQQLNAYEQGIVDAQVPKDSGRWILSLKRTTIDIRSRDMLFQAVPGLQIVVQCHARQSPLLQEPRQQPASLDSAGRTHGSSTSHVGARKRERRLDLAQSVEEPPSPDIVNKRRREMEPPTLTSYQFSQSGGAAYVRPATQNGYTYTMKKQPSTLDQDENSLALDEEAEAEAEAMVNGLLKQYTTLYDS